MPASDHRGGRGPTSASRRRLLRRGGAGAVLAVAGAALPVSVPQAGAATASSGSSPAARATAERVYVPRPGRTLYDFTVAQTVQNPDGEKAMPSITVNDSIPGPEVRIREGEQFRALVRNTLDGEPTTIHWHGLLVPAGMDGVPVISNAPIAPQQMYVYEFPIRQSGTYWYHSHVGFEEQRGMYGAIVIESDDDPVRADHDVVVMLGDWLHRSPEAVFEELRRGDRPGGDAPAPTVTAGAAAMGKPDLSDVKYPSFLLNGRGGTAAPWTYVARPGERIRLRIVNSAASTYFFVTLDGHPLEVTHADGLAVEPVVVDQILMGMAECYDVVVTLAKPGSYTLHAVAQDGSGQAIGVLHTPDVEPAPNRTMPKLDGRQLSYAQLRALAPTTLPDGPERTFVLPLEGDMKRYVWMIDGQAWPDATPLEIRPGDRVRIEMPNRSMMFHPMHLHGHFFRVLQGAGDRCPLKHTVSVAPGETVRIEFTADNPGRWFFHCHNLYHLEAGMAREIVYVT
jgi:FtsP/CotA-like multicopper oxidase with cupredoxin domain